MRNARNRVVVDVVEELRDVDVHHPVLSFLRILLCGLHGVLRATPRSKPVTVLTEWRIEDRRQRLQQQLLNKPVLYRRNPQHSRTPAWFGYLYPPYRTRNVGPFQKFVFEYPPVRLKMRLQLRRGHSIHTRRSPVAFHRPQGQPVVLVRHDRFHQLLAHRSPSEGSQIPTWSLRSRLVSGCTASSSSAHGLATVVVAPVIRVLLFRRSPVPSLAPFLGSSALRSAAVTRLLRYYGLC